MRPTGIIYKVAATLIARFRNFLLYGEQGLAGKKALIDIFQDVLTLKYREQPLFRYSVEWQEDSKHLLRVGNPRLYEHPYQSPQLPLWEPGDVEWFVIIRTDPPTRRRRPRGRIMLIPPIVGKFLAWLTAS